MAPSRGIDPALLRGESVVGRAVLGGVAGTALLTLLLYASPLLGIPTPDLVGWLTLNERPVPFEQAQWWAAMVFHMLVGVFGWPLLYAVVLHPLLPGPTWLRGLAYGFILWTLLVAVVAPGLRLGVLFTLTAQPYATAVATLTAHLAYGLMVGLSVGPLPRRSSRARLLAWKAYR